MVLGKGNYSKIAPIKSYIDAQEFETPQKLAEYLQYLDKNETAYAEYFEWKKYYKMTYKDSLFCKLCKFLNDDTMPINMKMPIMVDDRPKNHVRPGKESENTASTVRLPARPNANINGKHMFVSTNLSQSVI